MFRIHCCIVLKLHAEHVFAILRQYGDPQENRKAFKLMITVDVLASPRRWAIVLSNDGVVRARKASRSGYVAGSQRVCAIW
jgi:hypothetical protein